jgi:uncharacterized membrane protein
MVVVRARSFLGRYGFLVSLVYLTVVCAGFFVAGAISNHSLEFWYLLWNLFLAWLPLVFALWLVRMLHHKAWSSWQGMVLSLLWLGFLPNSFYMVSDFIHLQDYQRVDIVFDTAMFASFVLTSLFLGYVSLYLVHVELAKRLRGSMAAWVWVSLVLALCSFAIYLGRDLRWNTWDILVSPAGILFDVSDIVLHPTGHVLALTTTLTFFVFLISVYIVIWQFVRKSQSTYRASR